MKVIRLLVPFCLAVAMITSCNDCKENPTAGTDLTVKFHSTYDGNRLVRYADNTYNGYPLEFSRFTLFLSDITLLNGTEETVLSEAEYLDFMPDNSSTDTSSILTYTFNNVPEGDYTGIKIGYGVKPSNNSKNPADFPPSSPLYEDNEYWLGWKSYIFCKIEGQGDSDNNGLFDTFLIYHCGGNGVYKSFTFNQPIHVEAGQKGLDISFDLKKLFVQNDGSFYNIVKDPATSNNKDSLRVANDIMSKFDKATTISQ